MEDALLRDLLELVRGRGFAVLEQAEDGIGGVCEAKG
jgi:hypothetical protein